MSDDDWEFLEDVTDAVCFGDGVSIDEAARLLALARKGLEAEKIGDAYRKWHAIASPGVDKHNVNEVKEAWEGFIKLYARFALAPKEPSDA